VSVPDDHGAVLFEACRVAQQGSVLESAVAEVEQLGGRRLRFVGFEPRSPGETTESERLDHGE
jgi:hypothetical protein